MSLIQVYVDQITEGMSYSMKASRFSIFFSVTSRNVRSSSMAKQGVNIFYMRMCSMGLPSSRKLNLMYRVYCISFIIMSVQTATNFMRISTGTFTIVPLLNITVIFHKYFSDIEPRASAWHPTSEGQPSIIRPLNSNSRAMIKEAALIWNMNYRWIYAPIISM